ncbi:MAG TPA: hypothetical protein VLA00_16135 [Xanthobacteraceae bacterium]|nr:hypothetical protein [Xanthobacteraceae bacterium]
MLNSIPMPVGRSAWRGLLPLLAFGGVLFASSPAPAAVIYCTGPGIPYGCVVRAAPVARAVVYCTRPGYPVGCVAGVAAPAARAAVRCTRPGYPAGCFAGAGAPGPGVSPVNRGGPVNRIGVR